MLTLGLIIALLFGLTRWLRSLAQRRPAVQSQNRVSVDEHGVSCSYAKGELRTVAWPEIASIRIRTNDSGPWSEDVFWGFHRASGEIALIVPQGAVGNSEMLRALQRLPGWNDKAVITAMGSTSNAEFICWERGPEQ